MRRVLGVLAGRSIRTRLVTGAVLVVVLPLAATVLMAWPIQRDAAFRSMLNTLRVLVEQKEERLSTLASAWLSDLSDLSRAEAVRASIRRLEPLLAKDSGAQALSEALQSNGAVLEGFRRGLGMDRMLLLWADGAVGWDSQGKAVVGRGLDQPSLPSGPLRESIARAGLLLQPEFTAPWAAEGGQLEVWAVTPLMDGARCAGFLAGQVPQPALYSVFRDAEPLGRTGCTLAAVQVGERVMLLKPSRSRQAIEVSDGVRAGSPRLAELQAALQGHSGSGSVQDDQGERVLAAWNYDPVLRWAMATQIDESEVRQGARDATLVMVGTGLAAAVPVAVLAALWARRLAGPIAVASEAAERVAGGDLTRPPTDLASGELGRLLDAIRTMTANLQSGTGSIRQLSRRLLEVGGRVRSNASEQDAVAHGFGASAAQIAAAVNQITATGRELAIRMEAIAGDATSAASMAQSGRGGLERMGQSMHALRNASQDVATALQDIRARTESIGGVAETIVKVASQTNLLSVNAAIEAEKAGPFGAGFQAVAREINRLADRVSEAVEDITRTVKEVQESVACGERQMHGFRQALDQGLDVSQRLSGELGGIIGSVERLQEGFGQVASGMRAQSEGSRQIAEAMGQLTHGARSTASAVQAFLSASTELESAARELESQVQRFRTA
jgi:methyl-accepting chemotaxis protein WspA